MTWRYIILGSILVLILIVVFASERDKFMTVFSVINTFLKKSWRLLLVAVGIALLIWFIFWIIGDDDGGKEYPPNQPTISEQRLQQENAKLGKENRGLRKRNRPVQRKQPTELTLGCVDIGSHFTRVYPLPYNINLRVGDEIIFLDRLEGIEGIAFGKGSKNGHDHKVPEYGVIYPNFYIKYLEGEKRIILWGNNLNIKNIRVIIRKKS